MEDDTDHGLLFDPERRDRKMMEHDLAFVIDPGSSEYLFAADYETIVNSLKGHFPDAYFEHALSLHSPMAGTTIDIILAGLSVGAGLAGAEMAKQIGKDLWEAVKGAVKSAAKSRFQLFGHRGGVGADSISVTILRGKTKLTLELDAVGPGDESKVRAFLEVAVPKLLEFRSELDQSGGEAAHPRISVPASAEYVRLAYDQGKLVLGHPVCLACLHLFETFLHSPCQHCIHNHEKPGKHSGRQGITQIDRDGKQTVFDDNGDPIPDAELVDYSAMGDNFAPLV
jgi:hypothetical protein